VALRLAAPGEVEQIQRQSTAGNWKMFAHKYEQTSTTIIIIIIIAAIRVRIALQRRRINNKQEQSLEIMPKTLRDSDECLRYSLIHSLIH